MKPNKKVVRILIYDGPEDHVNHTLITGNVPLNGAKMCGPTTIISSSIENIESLILIKAGLK